MSCLQMLAVYRSILADGLHPDQYTFNAILTTMCKFGTSLYAVDDLLGEMYKWGVKVRQQQGNCRRGAAGTWWYLGSCTRADGKGVHHDWKHVVGEASTGRPGSALSLDSCLLLLTFQSLEPDI